MDDTRKKVIECLDNVGISISDDESILTDYLEDSVVFVSFVIELEEMFQFEFETDTFSDDTFSTIESLIEYIEYRKS